MVVFLKGLVNGRFTSSSIFLYRSKANLEHKMLSPIKYKGFWLSLKIKMHHAIALVKELKKSFAHS
jgi:hypothetical protein